MKAIFTTKKDLSAEYFAKNNWDVYLYDTGTLKDKAPIKDYGAVYFRDPFNDSTLNLDIVALDNLITQFSAARSIDGIRSYDDMITFEDKWNQAQKYSDFTPKTYLPSQIEFIKGQHLAKKRISQRAKDILFELDGRLDDQWIIQELLDIKEELRVYAVFSQVIPQATIKASKINGKVKVIGARELNAKEIEFCSRIAEKSGLDFIGIDLAVLEGSDLRLIEVNRSPQFKRFVELYGEEPLTGILSL